MFNISDYYGYTANIKVQNVPSAEQAKNRNGIVIVLGSIASLFGLFSLILILVFSYRKSKDFDEVEEYDLDYVPGIPTRYSITRRSLVKVDLAQFLKGF